MEETIYRVTETVIYLVPAASKEEAYKKFRQAEKPREAFESFVDDRVVRREDGEYEDGDDE